MSYEPTRTLGISRPFLDRNSYLSLDDFEHHRYPILTPKFMTKTKEIRVKLSDASKRVLDEYCETFGVTQSSAISGLSVEKLAPPLARVRHFLTEMNNIQYSKPCPKTATKRKPRASQIPDDFDPPKSITEEVGLNHEMALDAFTDWAVARGTTYVDWVAAFRNACRGWIPERFPQAKLSNQTPENYL